MTREWEGTWTPGYARIHLTFCGIGSVKAELSVAVDGKEAKARRGEDGRYRVAVPPDFKQVTVDWAPASVEAKRVDEVNA